MAKPQEGEQLLGYCEGAAKKAEPARQRDGATAAAPARVEAAAQDGDSAKVAVVPNEFVCPISQEIMGDPVIVVESSQTYEKKEIEKWFRTNSARARPCRCLSLS